MRKATGAPVHQQGGRALPFQGRYQSLLLCRPQHSVPPAENLVQDGEVLNLGGMEFEVLATPGHTKGGICYYNKENKFAFVGDTVFCESIGRTDLPGGSYKQILESIKNKILVLDACVALLPGHGPQTLTVGRERRRNPFLQ